MEKQWAGTTYGSGWMHRQLIRLLRHVDVLVPYVFSAIFIVPVCLLINSSRRTAYRYFRDRQGFGRLKSVWKTYTNHCLFSQVVIDKFAMYAGRRFDVTVKGMDLFDQLAARDEGFEMLSSHIGNYEIAGYSLVSERKKINAVVYEFEKQQVMLNRSNMFGRTNVGMIALKQDMSHLFEIDTALSSGDIVSFPADRSMGGRCIECELLGAKADLPLGPFRVAAMRSLDVLAVNVMKTGLRSYTIYVTPLEYDKEASRNEQVQMLSNAYSAELEKMLKAYPDQWFNFFDFWKK